MSAPSGTPDRAAPAPPILVCPLSRVHEVVAAHAPELIVSLLDPEFRFPDVGPRYAGRHLRLSLHDVHDAAAGLTAPSAAHVRTLLAFLARWERAAPLLIHCRAGMSRSTASAFIAACLHNPHADERAIAVALRRASPSARPNEAIVRLADAALGRGGRMAAAIAETGRDLAWPDVSECEPFALASVYGR